jgi:hypothetical protein
MIWKGEWVVDRMRGRSVDVNIHRTGQRRGSVDVNIHRGGLRKGLILVRIGERLVGRVRRRGVDVDIHRAGQRRMMDELVERNANGHGCGQGERGGPIRKLEKSKHHLLGIFTGTRWRYEYVFCKIVSWHSDGVQRYSARQIHTRAM